MGERMGAIHAQEGKRRAVVWTAVGLTAVAAFGGCSQSPPAPSETPSAGTPTPLMRMTGTVVHPDSLRKLEKLSDVIVVGSLEDSPERINEAQLARGVDPHPVPVEIPMLAYTVVPSDVLAGVPTDTMKLARYDTGKIRFEEQGSTPTNTELVLFLRSTGLKDVYVLAGGDQGLVAVGDDGSLKWRYVDRSDGSRRH